MEQILQWISGLMIGDGLVIAVGTFVLGLIIKQSLDGVPNKFIPLICGVAGIILALTIPDILEGMDAVSKGIAGLAIGWSATGLFETYKNFKENSEQ